MFCTCLHTSGLQTKDGLICTNRYQERVSAEAFPVSTPLGDTAHVHGWTQCDVYSFANIFFSHRNTTRTEKRAFPSAFVLKSVWNINYFQTYVDAALMPAGKAVTKSAILTPSGESWRHRPGKSPTAGVFPEQTPLAQPIPVVILTFCSSVKVATLKSKNALHIWIK